MAGRIRSFWLVALTVAYVCLTAIQATGAWLSWALLVLLPLGLAEVWRRTELPPHAEDRFEPAARTAVRVCCWGTAMWIAARTGPAGRPAFDAAANLGTAAVGVGALLALARIRSAGGLLAARPATRSLDAAAFTALLWGVAIAVPAAHALLPAQEIIPDPLRIDYATTSAGLANLLVLVAATWRLRILRRLEMGVSERAAGALALAVTAVVVAVPASALDVAPPDRVLPAAVILASLACTWAATTRDPTLVASALRGVLAIMVLGTPITLFAGLVARGAPDSAGAVVLATAIVSIAVGLVARAVARPLGPEQSRWLDAIDAASRGALQPEPDAAIRAALAALGRATSTPGARPELWRNDPEEVLNVDIAGYLHVEKAQAPDRLYELALEEPERTLRAEVLAALEVRRPEVRPILSWFEIRRAFSATVVLDEDGPLGFILLPRGNRAASMTMEEARAIRLLGDRLSSLLAVSSALARSRERELSAIARADAIDDERQRLEHILELGASRNQAVAEREARAVRTTAYGPAARTALERIERLGRLDSPIVLLTHPGQNPLGWAAVAHLESTRSGGPFVVVDAADGVEHKIERWQDDTASPLALADGGTLLIVNVAALPLSVQEHAARTLSRRGQAPLRSTIPMTGIIVSSTESMAPLVERDRLSPELARWLGDAEVEIPTLANRSEDLRAIVLSELTRVGLQTQGRPLGIEPAALRLLVEHTWPGNELELCDVLLGASAITAHEAIRAEDLFAIGFRPIVEASETPAPAPVLRRSRRPPVRRR